MFVLESQIKIGDYAFDSIHDVEISKSVDELADTATIKLPTKFKVRQDGAERFTEEAIKIGDPVRIVLGYEGKYSGEEFVGYVKKISPKTPLEIHCEDAMWLLRRKNITKSWTEKTTLAEVLREVVKNTPIELADKLPEIPLSKWIIKNANGTQVLQKIKDELLMSVYIDDDGKLYCGLQQGTNIGQVVKYDLDYNLVENNLEFRRKEDRKVKVKYIYKDPENKETSLEVGDADGETHTYYTSVVSDKAKLREMAEAEIAKLKYDGYDGDVKSFLLPFANRGMSAELVDADHPNRNGGYFVKKAITTFGTGGARRKVILGGKLYEF
jgi:hypothetical protein